MSLGATQPLVKMSTRNIPGGKGGRCVRLTTSPPSRAECHEIWEPKPPVTFWAAPGMLRDSFTLYAQFHILVTINIYICPLQHSPIRHCNGSTLHLLPSEIRISKPCISWLRWMVTCLSLLKSFFNPWPVHSGHLVVKLAQVQVFIPALRFSPVNIIPPILPIHTCNSI